MLGKLVVAVGAHLDPSSCLSEPHTCCYTPTNLDGVTSHKTAIRILRLWRTEILTRMLAETCWPILRFSKEKTLPRHNRRRKCTVSVAAILTFVRPEQKTSFREMLQLSKSTSSETWRLSDWKLLYRHGVISLNFCSITAMTIPDLLLLVRNFRHAYEWLPTVQCLRFALPEGATAIGHLQKEAAPVCESLRPLRNTEGGQVSPYARRTRKARKGRKGERNLWNVSG